MILFIDLTLATQKFKIEDENRGSLVNRTVKLHDLIKKN